MAFRIQTKINIDPGTVRQAHSDERSRTASSGWRINLLMLFHLHLPHYFANKVRKEVEHLYASIAIGSLAQALITIFEPIFLYVVLDFSIEQVLLFMAAVYALYVLLIPFGAKIASRFGYAHAIFFSIPFQILFWFLLLGSQHQFGLIYAAPLLFAIQKALFWPAYHATLSRFANGTQRGREFSVVYTLAHFMEIIGPLLAGFLSLTFGISVIFVIGSIIFLCSAIPLFWSQETFTPKIYQYRDTWQMYKTYPARFLGYWGFGEELLVLTIWPIFIYTIVRNYEDLGALVTIASLVSMAIALYVGAYTDKHSKREALRIGGIFYLLSWLARIPVVSAFGVFITDALSRTAKSLVFIPLSTLTYERAESTHIMPYIVGFEQGLAFGKFIAAVLGIIVFASTGSFVALFILAAVFSLFYFLL
jgi:MFS family permease